MHDSAARDRLKEAGIAGVISVTGTHTLVDKRNHILRKAPPGEWFIGMDDNIHYFTMVSQPFYDNKMNATDEDPPNKVDSWRAAYNVTVAPREWLRQMSINIGLAKAAKSPLVGVATMENPYFRARHFSNYRFVKTKVFAMANYTDLRFEHDYKATMYEEGGLGNREEREKRGLLDQMDAICNKFPGLVTVGKGANTALKFRLVTKNGVARWRKENGYVRS